MNKGSLIGRGRTAEVYLWEDNKALKLYYDWYSREQVKLEADISRAVHEAGIPSPRVHGMVNKENRQGIVFERIYGPPMLKYMEAKPWLLFQFARRMAKLHHKMHGCSVTQLPAQAERVSRAIKESAALTGGMKQKILAHLETLPGEHKVCHGDFHPGNIILAGSDEFVIDWSNAYAGHPLSDLARTCILITTPFMDPGAGRVTTRLARPLKKLLWRAYLKEYCRLGNLDTGAVDAWTLPAAAARLSEKVPGEENWLLSVISKRMKLLTYFL